MWEHSEQSLVFAYIGAPASRVLGLQLQPRQHRPAPELPNPVLLEVNTEQLRFTAKSELPPFSSSSEL